MTEPGSLHIGRSWRGTEIENTCPCPKEPCGLVDTKCAATDCTQHPVQRAKSIRQSHRAEDCPGSDMPTMSELCECERWRDGITTCPVHGTTKSGSTRDTFVERVTRRVTDAVVGIIQEEAT